MSVEASIEHLLIFLSQLNLKDKDVFITAVLQESPITLREIAEVHSISREMARQLLENSLRLLRHWYIKKDDLFQTYYERKTTELKELYRNVYIDNAHNNKKDLRDFFQIISFYTEITFGKSLSEYVSFPITINKPVLDFFQESLFSVLFELSPKELDVFISVFRENLDPSRAYISPQVYRKPSSREKEQLRLKVLDEVQNQISNLSESSEALSVFKQEVESYSDFNFLFDILIEIRRTPINNRIRELQQP